MNIDEKHQKWSGNNVLKVPEDFDYEYIDSDDEY
jgi:hypothetical protein